MKKNLLQLTALTLAATVAGAQDLALRAATVHTGNGAPITGGTILITKGKIQAVGADVEVPDGVRLIDHPGHISAGMVALRDGAGAGSETLDTTRAMLPSAELRHAHAPGHDELSALLAEGVTSLQFAGHPTALVGGMTAVVKASGDSVVHPRCYLAVSLSSDALRTNRYPTSYAAALDELATQIDGGQGTFAMVKAKNLPLWVYVESRHEVQRAIEFLASAGIGGVIHGADRAGEFAQRLAETKLGVALPAFRLGDNYHTDRSTVALAEAGVPFGFALDSPGNDPSALRLAAAGAVRAGLDANRAWAAVTSDAALLCRSEGRIGSLAPGLDADLVLWSGTPLDLGSRVLTVFVDGERVYDLPKEERKKILEALEEEADELPPGVTEDDEVNEDDDKNNAAGGQA